MTCLFLSAVGFCLYTYLLFPLLLHLLARSARDSELSQQGSLPTPRGDAMTAGSSHTVDLPRVSIVIAAHNEVLNLPTKIASLDALDYPQDRLECIFVSDGSTDGTVAMLRKACEARNNWKFQHYDSAAGKPTALNLGVLQASGDIVVFMDARQSVAHQAIRALTARLDDAAVGAVSGELVLRDDLGREASNVGLYWRYEKWIRDNDSRLFSTTGATGALYAIRRADYQALLSDALLDDFETPVALLKAGKRTVFEPAACVFDQAEADTGREFRRKVRTLAGNFQSFSRNRWLFHPRRNPVWWQFLSHKVFRLLVPYALTIALMASLFGQTPFLRLMLLLQVCFYGLGLLGMLGMQNRLSSLIKLFLQLNAAAVIGAWRACNGGSAVRWKSS